MTRKQMKITMAKKFEKAYAQGKVYLSAEGLDKVLKAANSK